MDPIQYDNDMHPNPESELDLIHFSKVEEIYPCISVRRPEFYEIYARSWPLPGPLEDILSLI